MIQIPYHQDHPPLMTPVQSQAETIFSFSEILFHM
jgi:hypothetical protein